MLGGRWEGGVQGGGGLACTGLQTWRLILQPGGPYGQQPDATSFWAVSLLIVWINPFTTAAPGPFWGRPQYNLI